MSADSRAERNAKWSLRARQTAVVAPSKLIAMPNHEPLKIVGTEAHTPEGRRYDSEKYTVRLTLNRQLTDFERQWINTTAYQTGARPLGISGANPQTLPRTLMISDTTLEEVAAARDDIKAFVAAVETNGHEAERQALDEADAYVNAARAEEIRRKAIADSIDWT
ncbi:hypothetical protein JCM12141A_60890 [Mycolicibacterium hodleri]